MELLGIGVDIVSIERIETVIQRRGDAFAQKILSENEYSVYIQKKRSAAYLAKRFAVKESVIKMLKASNGRYGVSLKDIECLNSATGEPLITLYGNAKKRFSELLGENIFVSISDEKKYAIAYVTASKFQ